MNKKILISLLTMGLVVFISIGATIAYFNDTETSSGNIFTAGSIDLKINNNCTYNGQPVQECIWQETDLTNQLFFNYNDVKPGDWGENTISLHVHDNPAWVCAKFSNLKSYENQCNNPEIKASDITCDNPGEGQGELQNYLNFTVWKDVNCDNIQDSEEQVLVDNQPVINGYWPIADKNHGTPITNACIGVKWNIPASTGNIIQGDGLTGDISFFAIQSRNNDNFICETGSFFDDFNDGNTDGWLSVPPAPWLSEGNWRLENNMLLQDLGGDNYKFLQNNFLISDQSVEVKLNLSNYAGVGGIIVWYQDYNNFINVYMYPAYSSGLRVVERINGVSQTYIYPYTYSYYQWYELKINANSITGEIEVYVDDVYLFTHTTTTSIKTGLSGLNSSNSGGYFDDFSLISNDIPSILH
ncbi:MAG: hypothetical protein MCSN_3470 [Candidatus Microsyncoccus archaeolyticus]|nr:MAG: hypothetical protein MCSN_3470 [Candidatus Parcubacteria bacterium]